MVEATLSALQLIDGAATGAGIEDHPRIEQGASPSGSGVAIDDDGDIGGLGDEGEPDIIQAS